RRARSAPVRLHAWCPQPGHACVTRVTQRPQRYVSRPMAKIRLDTLLHRRGLFESRARAAASVMAGEVRLGDDGPPAAEAGQEGGQEAPLAAAESARASSPGWMVAAYVARAVAERPRFVSRGGIKLANALVAPGVEPAGRRC